jgi:hypothetical protein
MKKALLSFSLILLNGIVAFSQTTAIDFTANDCSGTSHHLFAELDAGKIVVVSFVMPCGMCISPSLSAQSTVNSYAASHPGKVVFYVADNAGSPTCSSLSSWASTNGMSTAPTFSDATVKQTDYGSMAMPKIVVLAGTSHKVIFSQDNGLNTTNLQTAINGALSGSFGFLGAAQTISENSQLSIFPNPANDKISVSYNLDHSSDVNIEIYNAFGSKVKAFNAKQQISGQNTVSINFDNTLSNGIYFLKLEAAGSSQIMKFVIAN